MRGARESEVGDHHSAFLGQENIGGFQIAMQNSRLMSGFQSGAKLAGEFQQFLVLESILLQPVFESLPAKQFHGEELDVTIAVAIEDTADIDVRDAAGELEFLRRTDGFQRDMFAVLDIDRRVDASAHAADPNAPFNAIAVGQDLAFLQFRGRGFLLAHRLVEKIFRLGFQADEPLHFGDRFRIAAALGEKAIAFGRRQIHRV